MLVHNPNNRKKVVKTVTWDSSVQTKNEINHDNFERVEKFIKLVAMVNYNINSYKFDSANEPIDAQIQDLIFNDWNAEGPIVSLSNFLKEINDIGVIVLIGNNEYKYAIMTRADFIKEKNGTQFINCAKNLYTGELRGVTAFYTVDYINMCNLSGLVFQCMDVEPIEFIFSKNGEECRFVRDELAYVKFSK